MNPAPNRAVALAVPIVTAPTRVSAVGPSTEPAVSTVPRLLAIGPRVTSPSHMMAQTSMSERA